MEKNYAQKRHFDVTPEPVSSTGKRPEPGAKLTFVVQKHESRRPHFDLRLELDGVLKSWAILPVPSVEESSAMIISYS